MIASRIKDTKTGGLLLFKHLYQSRHDRVPISFIERARSGGEITETRDTDTQLRVRENAITGKIFRRRSSELNFCCLTPSATLDVAPWLPLTFGFLVAPTRNRVLLALSRFNSLVSPVECPLTLRHVRAGMHVRANHRQPSPLSPPSRFKFCENS